MKKSTLVIKNSPPGTLYWRRIGNFSKTGLVIAEKKLLPSSCTIAPPHDECKEQSHDKNEHLAQTDPTDLFELDRPRQQEHGFDIEHHKNQREHIETNVRRHIRRANRLHATLVNRTA